MSTTDEVKFEFFENQSSIKSQNSTEAAKNKKIVESEIENALYWVVIGNVLVIVHQEGKRRLNKHSS